MRFLEYVEIKNFEKLLVRLVEEGTGFSIKDYTTDVPSDRNKKFFKERQDEGKTGSKLQDAEWTEDSIFLTYRVVPTYDETVSIVDDNTTIQESDHYIVRIMFEDAEKHLGKKEEFFTELKKGEQVQMFSEMVKHGTVKVQSNDMSWYFQGCWEASSELGHSILPFPASATKGKGIWSRKHTGENPGVYITKHILETVKTIPFVKSDIVKKLRDKYSS